MLNMSKFKSLLDEKQAELIKSLGLSEAEIAVYLATLELGQANVQEISRKSGVKRTSIYNFWANRLAPLTPQSMLRGCHRSILSPCRNSWIDFQVRSRVANI